MATWRAPALRPTTSAALERCVLVSADDDAHVDFPVFIQTVASRYADHIVRHLLESL